MIHLTSVSPILPAADISRTVSFYREKLAFSVTYQDQSYAIVQRDAVAIHFWKAENVVPEMTDSGCYVYVRGIEELYESLSGQEVIHPNGKLEKKPWGLKEFSVLDPNGNLIRLGEPV
jgi:catechol 2,3-dioxygenase-like lactoylglutathione lyase family enzyme